MNASTQPLQELEGTFEVYEGEMKGRQISIQAKEDHLLFDNALEFFPLEKDLFFDIDNDLFTLEMERNNNGKVIGFSRSDHRGFQQKARKISLAEVRTLNTMTLSKAELEEYLGNYEFGSEGMMPGHRPKLSISQGGLLIDNMMQFLPYEKDRFFMKDDIGMRLSFQRNDTGQITGILVLREKEVVGRVKRLQ